VIDFQTALKARLPFIGIHTDDPVHVKDVLARIAGKEVRPLPSGASHPLPDICLWWANDLALVTDDAYKKLKITGGSCVIINPEKPSMLVYDTGVLVVPDSFFIGYLKQFIQSEDLIQPLVQVLRGLSLKTAAEAVQLTMARTGSILPQDVRKTRQLMGGAHPGLEPLSTDFDFYDMPKPLKEWLYLNDKYFLNPKTPPQLVPRGLLLKGDPGVGKSMASMALAKHWDVPLFRLDIGTSLNRWLGESEGRVARNLQQIELNAPCVLLLDEAEKQFGGSGGDEGTARRILSQTLWWLQYHKAQVLTVMTTNDIDALPKELYRALRIDKVMTFEKLQTSAAHAFARKTYQSVLGKAPTEKRNHVLGAVLSGTTKVTFSHAEVRVLVYETIKANNWLEKEKA